jgi:meso-butanediol dehydrogenase/(S,S)-butanediol dehydrogenase/diacetyl reductase
MPVAIVTGASQGIGRGIALRLAQDGFDVVVNDIERQKARIDEVVAEIQAGGHQAHGVVGDVSKQEDVQGLVDVAVATFGELNVMVANAGLLETSSLLEMTVERWDRTYAVNTRGVFLCYSLAARQMVKQGSGGKLIAACSISGYRPSGKAPAYCSSKWAVRGLTQTAALEFGEYGITVNAYCPGSVKTGMSTVFAERLKKDREKEAVGTATPSTNGAAAAAPSVDEVYKTSSHRKNALNQELFPEDIAGLVSFLASKDSSRITGQTIICDGGKFLSASSVYPP